MFGKICNILRDETEARLGDLGVVAHWAHKYDVATVSPVLGPTGPLPVSVLYTRTGGLFLVRCDCHVVGVNCDRREVYCDGQSFPLPLNDATLQLLGIRNIHDWRKVTLHE